MTKVATRYETEVKNKGGRPQKYKTVQGLNKGINGYFNKQNKTGEPYTISGLALSLGLSTQSLGRYASGDRDKNQECDSEYTLSDTIQQAKDRIMEQWETNLYNRGNAGDIFAMKNFGWHDKQEIETTHTGSVEFTNHIPRPKVIEGEILDEKVKDNNTIE